MCWFLFLFRVMFKKREPDNDDAYILARRDRDGYVEVPASIKEPFELEMLPIELVGKIFSELSYTDAMHLRQASHQTMNVYNQFRGQIEGPKTMAYINIEKGNVVTRARPYHVLCGEATLIPREKRCAFFRNANVWLTIRLGETQMTHRFSSEILETFDKSTLESVQLKAATVSHESRELLNNLNCLHVTLNIGRYDENVAQVANVKSLQVKTELLFFQLESIVRRDFHLEYLNATVTAASLPRIMECIEEWRNNQRKILSWYFLVPLVQILQNYGGVPIDWRRSICHQEDGTGRLLMQTKTIEPQFGDLVTYQTVNWLRM